MDWFEHFVSHKTVCIRSSVAHCGWTYWPHQKPSSNIRSQRMSRRHHLFSTPINTSAPAIRQNIHGNTKHYYGEEIRCWQLQNKSALLSIWTFW
jgi:hypothetical protein